MAIKYESKATNWDCCIHWRKKSITFLCQDANGRKLFSCVKSSRAYVFVYGDFSWNVFFFCDLVTTTIVVYTLANEHSALTALSCTYTSWWHHLTLVSIKLSRRHAISSAQNEKAKQIEFCLIKFSHIFLLVIVFLSLVEPIIHEQIFIWQFEEILFWPEKYMWKYAIALSPVHKCLMSYQCHGQSPLNIQTNCVCKRNGWWSHETQSPERSKFLLFLLFFYLKRRTHHKE